MKGRIIGREGRNIRAFESVTGVNLIIDDTPEAVLLSCFDPVRREIGRLTLETLIAGRPDPPAAHRGGLRARPATRSSGCAVRAGEDAAGRGGHHRPAPGAGRRCSAGCATARRTARTCSSTCVESAHIAGMMAAELRPRPDRWSSACAFLHDIGKALTHEVEGSPRARSAPSWPASTASTRTSCTPSRRTTTRSSRAPSRRCSPRPPTRSAAAGRAPGASRWRRTSSGCERLEEIAAGARRAWRRSSPCRPAARSG